MLYFIKYLIVITVKIEYKQIVTKVIGNLWMFVCKRWKVLWFELEDNKIVYLQKYKKTLLLSQSNDCDHFDIPLNMSIFH